MPNHDVTEIFDSIQGEGSLAGTLSTFVRMAHCNLSCSWCDAAYTWKGNVKYKELSTEHVLAQVNHAYVVLTGGEPTIAEGFADLAYHLSLTGAIRHVTVETNGVTPPGVDEHHCVSLWSVSPKLGSSGQAEQLNLHSLTDFAHLSAPGFPDVQWKFVIDTEEDFHAAIELLNSVDGAATWPVYFQPNGLCANAEVWETGNLAARELHDQGTRVLVIKPRAESYRGSYRIELRTPYADRFRWLVELILRHSHSLPYDVRVLPQVHKLAFGNKRGH